MQPKCSGANCGECPFKDQPFCPPEPSAAPRFIALLESPGSTEVVLRRPCTGKSGRRFDKGLQAAGLLRSEAHITNTVLCQPPKGVSSEQWNDAKDCCSGRLHQELAPLGDLPIIAFGTIALQAATGRTGPGTGISNWFGYPVDGMGTQIFPLFHPAFALRKPEMWPVFYSMMQRAGEFVRGTLVRRAWPKIIVEPGEEMLQALAQLHKAGNILGCDVENCGDPMFSDLLNVGVGNEELGLSIPWPPRGPYGEQLQAGISSLLSDPSITTVYHNCQHDLLALEAHGLRVLGPIEDTLSMHQALWPQLPHDLGFVAVQLMVLERWKSQFHAGTESKGLDAFIDADPMLRGEYNAKDCIGGLRVRECLKADLALACPRAQKRYAQLAELVPVCIDMRRKGLPVSKIRKDYYAEKLTQEATRAVARFEELRPRGYEKTTAKGKTVLVSYSLGMAGMTASLKQLFFDHFKLTPLHKSKKTGAPALDAWTLVMYAARNPGDIADIALAVIKYRKACKLKGTYCDGLQVGPDGCVHSAWKAGGTVTGRLASAQPNMQNVTKKLRAMFCAPPGFVLLAADGEQVELRLTAVQADDKPLLESFMHGEKVHLKNARDLFGDQTITKEDRRYTRGKNLVYNFNYGGRPETAWEMCVKDDPSLKLTQVEIAQRRWFELHPAIKKLHKTLYEAAGKRKQTCAPGGHCAYTFHDGIVDRNVVYNFGTQATSAFLVTRAMVELAKLGFDIRLNVHDELVVLAPVDNWRPVARQLKSVMERPIRLCGKDWVFPVQLSVGRRWGSGMRDVSNAELAVKE